MRKPIARLIQGTFIAALLALPVWAYGSDQTNPSQAQPGTINYIEGKASIGTQALSSNSVGSVQLQQGQSLTTADGKVEVLLTPGVFLRVDRNSTLKMVSPSLLNTEVELDKGRATVEVDEIFKQNSFIVDENGASTRLLKVGLYEFDASRGVVRVFDGEAAVRDGDDQMKLKSGHEVTLAAAQMKPEKFAKDAYQGDDFYRWTALRSSYLAEANVDIARTYAENPGYYNPWWYGPWWFGAGWYWDPWWGAYTFIPGDGIFYSPFGWGFFSPGFVFFAPVSGGDGHVHHHFDPDSNHWATGAHVTPGAHATPGARSVPGARSAPAPSIGHAFRGGPGIGGGGFRGGPAPSFHAAPMPAPAPAPARPH